MRARKVLNVGGGAERELPATYKGWEQQLLDIDPAVNPDICLDAKALVRAGKYAGKFDAVFCSHNLEHFYRNEVNGVLKGFHRVLKADGFAQIAVPDMAALIKAVASGRELDDTWYVASGGPVTFHDVMYGWGRMVSQGNLYYAHHCGFTEKSLAKEIRAAGFARAWTACDDSGNLHAFAFKSPPTKETLRRLGI